MNTDRKILQDIDTILRRAEAIERQPPRATITYDELMRRRGTPIDWDAIVKNNP